jgi:hypothetical protein
LRCWSSTDSGSRGFWGNGLRADNLYGGPGVVIQDENGAAGMFIPCDNYTCETDELDRVVVVEVEILGWYYCLVRVLYKLQSDRNFYINIQVFGMDGWMDYVSS